MNVLESTCCITLLKNCENCIDRFSSLQIWYRNLRSVVTHLYITYFVFVFVFFLSLQPRNWPSSPFSPWHNSTNMVPLLCGLFFPKACRPLLLRLFLAPSRPLSPRMPKKPTYGEILSQLSGTPQLLHLM